MTPDEIQHFLLILDVDSGVVKVEPFGYRFEDALEAYERAEKAARDSDQKLDIVLLGADSLDTIKRTHSSYFGAEGDDGFARYIDALTPA